MQTRSKVLFSLATIVACLFSSDSESFGQGTVNFNNMKNAIIFGSALASFCVEKFGTEKIKNLTDAEVSVRIQEFVQLSAFEIV